MHIHMSILCNLLTRILSLRKDVSLPVKQFSLLGSSFAEASKNHQYINNFQESKAKVQFIKTTEMSSANANGRLASGSDVDDDHEDKIGLSTGAAADAAINNGEIRRMQDYKSAEPMWDPNVAVHWSVCEIVLLCVAWFIVAIIPIFWFYVIKTVRDYERALIFRLGKLKGGAEGPGVFWINPLIDTIYVVDLRIETYNLAPQGMMTKDAVTVTVDAICFMKVIDPIRAILEVDNYRHAFKLFAATTLRSVIGTYDLNSLLCERDKINEQIRLIIEEETSSWGVAVPSVEIKDVKLPDNMQRAMAAEAEADINKRAKVISAQGEAEAASQLAKAADAIADSPGALQLRYLHTLVQIASEKNSTILFPLPMEIMRGIQSFTAAQEALIKAKRGAYE